MVRKQVTSDFLNRKHEWRPLFAEVWGTFLLVLVAAGGGEVSARCGGAVSGSSMNPARSLAPDLVRGDLHTAWIYVAGPLLGARAGVAFGWILRGKPASSGATAAQGVEGVGDSTPASEQGND